MTNDHMRDVAQAVSMPWPKALNVTRHAANSWHGDISFARSPTDEELTALHEFLRVNHEGAAQPPAAPVETEDLAEVVIACCNGQMGRDAALEVISELSLAGFKIVPKGDSPSSAGSVPTNRQLHDAIATALHQEGLTYSGIQQAVFAVQDLYGAAPQPTQVTADQAAEDVRREREAKAERDRYAKMTTAEKCAVQGDGFINDYD